MGPRWGRSIRWSNSGQPSACRRMLRPYTLFLATRPRYSRGTRCATIVHAAMFFPELGEFGERRFSDRAEAGRVLAQALERYAGRDDLLVLALPRGGVPVGYEVARALHAPLDVFLVRKLGFPGHEELAMGAIATGGVRILDWRLIQMYGVPVEMIEQITMSEQRELQ